MHNGGGGGGKDISENVCFFSLSIDRSRGDLRISSLKSTQVDLAGEAFV